MNLRGKIITFIIILLILIAFCYSHHESRSLVIVAVREAKLSPVSPSIKLMGNVISEQGVDVSSKVNGIVKTIYFKSGQLVKKGDLLVELENDDIKAMLDQSTAKLHLAKQEYDRYSSLIKKGDISHADYDKSTSQLTSDQAEVSYQTALLNQTYIRAPFEGKVGIRNINIGQYISPGQTIVNLQNISSLYVDFNVPEQFANQVHNGSQVGIISDAGSGQIAMGKVIAIGASLNLDTRTLPVRSAIANHINALSPGMYVQVNLDLMAPRAAILIPQSAIVYSPMGLYVYKVIKHRVQQIKVETGEQVGDDIVITKGLAKGDVIVCAGQIKLHPGVLTKEVAY